jgi:hypothetical protein
MLRCTSIACLVFHVLSYNWGNNQIFGVGIHGPDLISQRREYEACALCSNSNLILTLPDRSISWQHTCCSFGYNRRAQQIIQSWNFSGHRLAKDREQKAPTPKLGRSFLLRALSRHWLVQNFRLVTRHLPSTFPGQAVTRPASITQRDTESRTRVLHIQPINLIYRQLQRTVSCPCDHDSGIGSSLLQISKYSWTVLCTTSHLATSHCPFYFSIQNNKKLNL